MSGSDGRYMSIDSEPSAVSMARSIVSESVPGRSIGAKYLEERVRSAGGGFGYKGTT